MHRRKVAAQTAALLRASLPIGPVTSPGLQASASPHSFPQWLSHEAWSGSKPFLRHSHASILAGLRALAPAASCAEPTAQLCQPSALHGVWPPSRGLVTGHVVYQPDAAGPSSRWSGQQGSEDRTAQPQEGAEGGSGAAGGKRDGVQEPRTASASGSASDRNALGLDVAEQTMPDRQILKTLAGYIMSADQPGLRSRIAVAMGLLVASKVLTIQVWTCRRQQALMAVKQSYHRTNFPSA